MRDLNEKKKSLRTTVLNESFNQKSENSVIISLALYWSNPMSLFFIYETKNEF